MKASLAVCILAALLALGACLQCEVCSGSGNNCTGSLQTCDAERDTCSVAVTETMFAGQKSQYIVKGCAKSSLCKASPVSVNLVKGLATQTIFACCVGEACRTVNVTVPPAETKPNGWRCPACYVFLFGQCCEQTIDCVGAQTQCINVTYNETIGGYPVKVVMKGCASESFCAHLKTDPETFTGIRANLTTAECREAYSARGVAPSSSPRWDSSIEFSLLIPHHTQRRHHPQLHPAACVSCSPHQAFPAPGRIHLPITVLH